MGAIIALLQIPSDRFLVNRGALVYENGKKGSEVYLWETPLRVTFLRNLLVFVLGVLYILTDHRQIFRVDDVFIVSGSLILVAVEYISENKLSGKLWKRPVFWNFRGVAFYAVYSDIFSVLSLVFIFAEMAAGGAEPYITLIASTVAGSGIAIIPIITYKMTKSLENCGIAKKG